jgi:hypothetical protein
METLPVTFTAQGMPARFANVHAGLDTVLDRNIAGPTERWTYIVTGIDVYGGPTGLTFAAWYNLDGAGKLFFWHETVDVADPQTAYTGSWRGALPLTQGEILQVGIESTIPAELSVAAWGLVVPYPMAVLE